MNGSYLKTREPSRDHKFAKLSRILPKETERSIIFADQSHLTCLFWVKLLWNVDFYAGPTDHALEEANSSRERCIKAGSLSGSSCLDLGFVKTGVFREKLRTWKVNAVESTSLNTSWLHFWKQNTQAGTMFPDVTWQQPTTRIYSPPRGLGHTVHQSTSNTARSNMSPKMVHRRLLGYDQVRNALRRLQTRINGSLCAKYP